MPKFTHKRLRLARLLLMVYVTMMAVVAFHHHDEMAMADVVACEDCAHHVHHSGHIYALQAAMHNCVLCQLQDTPYLAPSIATLVTPVVAWFVIRPMACSKRKFMPIDARSTRAPPYACFL